MGTEIKTRFGLHVRGEPRQLFSVLERANGDLLIMIPTVGNAELGDKEIPIKERRYSVHRSLKSESGGITIKETIRLEGGGTRENASFRTPAAGRVAHVLFLERNGLLESRDFSIRLRDKIIFLHDEDIGALTLIYGVVVSDFHLSADDLSVTNMSVWQEDFAHFRLSILTGFMFAASHPSSDIATMVTSLPVYGGQHHDERLIDIPTHGLSNEELVFQIKLGIAHLRDKLFARASKIESSDGTRPNPDDLQLMINTWLGSPSDETFQLGTGKFARRATLSIPGVA